MFITPLFKKKIDSIVLYVIISIIGEIVINQNVIDVVQSLFIVY